MDNEPGRKRTSTRQTNLQHRLLSLLYNILRVINSTVSGIGCRQMFSSLSLQPIITSSPGSSITSKRPYKQTPSRTIIASSYTIENNTSYYVENTDLIAPIPPTFRRLIAHRTGTSFSDVVEMEEIPMLRPGPGEVLIRVYFAGINGGCETFRCRGEYAFAVNKDKPSYTVGAEGAGVVVAIPDDGSSSTLRVGQHVTFLGGAFSEYVVAKETMCWPLQGPCSPQSVALTISGTVAQAALKYVAKIQPGDTVLVTAAGGATGSFAAQLAKLQGCRVIATCGTAEKQRRLETSTLGIDRVINYKNEDVYSLLKKEFRGKVDVAYEGVGGSLGAAAWDVLRRPGGRMLVIGYISEYPHVQDKDTKTMLNMEQKQQSTGLPPSPSLFWENKTHISADGRLALGKVWPSDRSETLAAKKEVFDMYYSGQLEAWVDDSMDFSRGVLNIESAVRYMLTGQAVGKVVVKFV